MSGPQVSTIFTFIVEFATDDIPTVAAACTHPLDLTKVYVQDPSPTQDSTLYLILVDYRHSPIQMLPNAQECSPSFAIQ